MSTAAPIDTEKDAVELQEKASSLQTVTDEDPGSAIEKGEEERRAWRKLDWHVLPLVFLLYLLSQLDRSNIGNVKIAGMSKDLHLIGLRYSIAAAIFFIPYSLVEIPSNVILKRTRPSRWIPSIVVACSLIMTLMCFVNSYHGLLVARLMLGMGEGGLFPGITYYLSLWYPRQMQATRIAIVYTSTTVAGASGGILAYGIEHLEGCAGLHGWQWIFLIEGSATFLVAIASYFLMSDYPSTARFLTERERVIVLRTLSKDAGYQATHFDISFVWQALSDWKVYVLAIINVCVLIPIFSITLFTPSIIDTLGYSAASAELLSIPPYFCGCLGTLAIGRYSDKLNFRGPFIILGATVSLISYIMAYATSRPGPGYVAAILAATGVYPIVPVVVAWGGGNADGDLKRGVVLATIIAIGSLGGIASSFIYFDPPRYHLGHGTNIGCLCLVIIGSSVLMWRYSVLNRQKEEFCAREGITEDMKQRYASMGNQSPLFRFFCSNISGRRSDTSATRSIVVVIMNE